MKPIFLIGYMGSGKSTLGHAIGMCTTMTFIDLDRYIETRFHCNIRDIFDTRGEAAFRDMERRMLDEVSQFENVVIACGGGTPCFENNMDLMLERGTTVWLVASHQRLFERLKAGRARRPLIKQLNDEELNQHITTALAARQPYYSRALHTFDSDYLDNVEQINQTVSQFINRFNLIRK
ncbi:MAG: shikimate kinase [Muribaculaceae bacterium]|nr:shikimate kinase [Muribaculaceae bacterium]